MNFDNNKYGADQVAEVMRLDGIDLAAQEKKRRIQVLLLHNI